MQKEHGITSLTYVNVLAILLFLILNDIDDDNFDRLLHIYSDRLFNILLYQYSFL